MLPSRRSTTTKGSLDKTSSLVKLMFSWQAPLLVVNSSLYIVSAANTTTTTTSNPTSTSSSISPILSPSSTGGLSSFEECEAESSTCSGVAVCLACMSGSGDDTDLPDQSECLERYPDETDDTGGSSSSSSSACESEGASYCCLFQDNDSAETCLEDPVTAALWQCIMERVNCSIEDMPCYGGNVSSIISSAGSSATSMSSSTADDSDEGNVGTAGDSSGSTSVTDESTGTLALSSAVADDDAASSADTDTSSNGAAGTASFLSVFRVGAGGLLVVTVGMALL